MAASSVRWNGEDLSTTFLSGTQLRASVPAGYLAAAGNAQITVFSPSPGGGISNSSPLAITNPAPSLCCLNPISAVAGRGDFLLIVYGSNFIPSAVVRWNGSDRTTTFVSSTRLEAVIGANDIANEGTASITVFNAAPGGGISNFVSISIVTLSAGAPTISRISPDSLPVGGESTEITINGTGFLPSSVVQFNGQNRSTTFVNNSQLTATLLAEDIATGLTNAITVTNPTPTPAVVAADGITASYGAPGTVSNTGVVTVLNPVPLITGLTPPSAKAGNAGFSITADGSKFVSSSTIRWNGKEKTTTFTNCSRLGGTIPDYDVAEEGKGTASVTVSNPGPGGGVSNSLTFTIRTKKTTSNTLYFPSLESSSSEMTGIAVANLSGTDAILTFWAFDRDGEEIKGPDITNPAAVSVAGAEQMAILDFQLYGSGLPEKSPVGWIKVDSTVSKVAGFFLSLDSDLSTMDGADVSSETLTSFVFPEIESAGFTQIHVASPGTEEAQVNFELYGSDGQVRNTATRKIKPNGAIAESAGDLFPGAALKSSDYIRASSNHEVVPFEYLGKTGKYVEGVNGQDANSGGTVLYSPQYVAGSGYATLLSIVNLEAAAGTVTLELFGDNGSPLGGSKVLRIPGRGKLNITDQNLFLDSGDSTVSGYVKITSSGPRLVGSVIFGDPAREEFAAALPLTVNLLRSFVYGQLASSDLYFTGVAILNPNEATAHATINVYDKNGNLVLTKTESIGAKQRISRLITEYFPQLNGRETSGYISVTVDQDVASFALFGMGSPTALSAIPPQVVR
jgi:hypothetical protein